MTPTPYRLHVSFWGSLLIVATLVGCSGYGGGLLESRQQITIDSAPQNASVYAEGVEIGMTPLVIKPGEVFEARFTGGDTQTGGLLVYGYVGTLSVKKTGCKAWSTQVNDNILSKDIHVELECGPDYQAVEVQPAAPAPVAVPSDVSAPTSPASRPLQPSASAEERLQRIESLHRKGLLSDEEYKALRQRVLDTL
jgi:hypothetical protein